MAEQDADKLGLAEGRMTLIGHLTELRNRLGVALGQATSGGGRRSLGIVPSRSR